MLELGAYFQITEYSHARTRTSNYMSTPRQTRPDLKPAITPKISALDATGPAAPASRSNLYIHNSGMDNNMEHLAFFDVAHWA